MAAKQDRKTRIVLPVAIDRHAEMPLMLRHRIADFSTGGIGGEVFSGLSGLPIVFSMRHGSAYVFGLTTMAEAVVRAGREASACWAEADAAEAGVPAGDASAFLADVANEFRRRMRDVGVAQLRELYAAWSSRNAAVGGASSGWIRDGGVP